MTIEEKNNYIEEYIKNIAEKNPDIFTQAIIQRGIEKFRDSEESLEELISKINLIANEFLEKNIEQRKYLQIMSQKFNDSNYQVKNIISIDISNLAYSQMEDLFFHYSWKKYLEFYDKNGMVPVIGENSKGIDPETSIFFSKGIEGVLELWDVWLKWRLDRQNNPKYQGNTPEEMQRTINRFISGDITEDERKKWYYWIEFFKDKQYLQNETMMKKLFEYQYTEMINSDYLIMDLKENEEFRYDQIDIKKLWVIQEANKNEKGINPFRAAMYGAYSDFTTPIADKWNMQTIPGKNIVIEPNRLKRLSIHGKTDVYSIIKFMYDKYKTEIPKEQQVKFDILDDYIKYIEEKKNLRIEDEMLRKTDELEQLLSTIESTSLLSSQETYSTYSQNPHR